MPKYYKNEGEGMFYDGIIKILPGRATELKDGQTLSERLLQVAGHKDSPIHLIDKKEFDAIIKKNKAAEKQGPSAASTVAAKIASQGGTGVSAEVLAQANSLNEEAQVKLDAATEALEEANTLKDKVVAFGEANELDITALTEGDDAPETEEEKEAREALESDKK